MSIARRFLRIHGRAPTTARGSTNLLLQYLADRVQIGAALPTEMRMTELGKSSRTAVRSALAHFVQRGLTGGMKDGHLLRKPRADDDFDVSGLHSNAENLSRANMFV